MAEKGWAWTQTGSEEPEVCKYCSGFGKDGFVVIFAIVVDRNLAKVSCSMVEEMEKEHA